MGWHDRFGGYWPGRKPDGMPRDGVAPDGYVVDGYRKVSKNGTIRFAKQTWTHPDFVPGEYVRCYYNWPDVVACIGWEGTDPYNISDSDRHSSFFDRSSTVLPTEVAAKAVARDAMRQIRDTEADNASDVKQAGESK